MSAFADLTLADYTPTNHTYSAIRMDGGIAKWQDVTGGVPVGMPTATFYLREATNAAPQYKMTTRLVYPVLDALGNLDYQVLCNSEVVFPRVSVQAVRRDAFALYKSLLAATVHTEAVNDFKAPY